MNKGRLNKNLIIIASFIGLLIFIPLLVKESTRPVLPSNCTVNVTYELINGVLHETCAGEFLRNYKAWSGASLTTVNNYLCEDYPSSSGCGDGYAICPNTALGGCAVDVYSNTWAFSHELIFTPGSTKFFFSTYCWEVYKCNTPVNTCTCTDWVYGSCNSNGCSNGYISKSRTCNPVNCQPQTACEIRSSCAVSYCNTNWVCDGTYRAYQNSDCSKINREYCAYGCTNGNCNPAPNTITVSCCGDDLCYYKNGNFDYLTDCPVTCANNTCVSCVNDYSTNPVCSNNIVTWKYCVNNVWQNRSFNCAELGCSTDSCSPSSPIDCCNNEYYGGVNMSINNGGI